MKCVPKALLEESGLWQEIELLRDLDHPCIARLYGTYEDHDDLFMVMEYCKGGELFEAIEEADGLSEDAARKAFWQMLGAISYIHGRGVCHRDLKPENFLLSHDLERGRKPVFKLIDFGTSRRFSPESPLKTKVCTLQYAAPEILARNTEPYTEKCDVWSLGVCLFVMFCGVPPFTADTDSQVMKRVRKGKFKFEPKEYWEEKSQDVKSLISSLLEVDVAARPSAREVLHNQWCVCDSLGPESPSNSVTAGAILPKLQDFQSYCWLKQRSLELVVSLLPDEAIEEQRSLWFKLDTDSRGELSLAEISRSLSGSAEVERMGTVKYTSFIAAVLNRAEVMDPVACRSAFRILDLDNDEHIQWQELAMIYYSFQDDQVKGSSCGQLGKVQHHAHSSKADNTSDHDAECKDFIGEYDVNGDKAMDFEEFMHMLRD